MSPSLCRTPLSPYLFSEKISCSARAKPSVTRGINLLKEHGMVTVDDNGSILLTDKGTSEAQRIYERHTVLTKMFMSLGVDAETASDDACRMEHYISDTTFNAIKKHMAEHE